MHGPAVEPVPRKLIALLAFSCGATVANLYYAQPLLSAIGGDLGVSDGTAGLLVTVSQVFYCAGLIFIAPLSDLVDRRRLVVVLQGVGCLALAGAAAAPGFAVLALAIAVASTTTVVAQILVPFASTIAPEKERGKVVGMVMSGLLSGILLARTFAGLLAGAAGWRTVFAIAAALMAVLGVVLWRALPDRPPAAEMSYGGLLRSVAAMVREHALLRRRMVYGACSFGGFSLVWTTLSFLLSASPFGYGEATIGLFGLAGLAGALAAMGSGRLHDAGRGRVATGIVLSAILVSWPLFLFGHRSVPLILLALVILDFGVQGQTVLSQGAIYGLGRNTAGRVTTAYIGAQFIGGAIGSAAGSLAWGIGGWTAVCVVGIAIAGFALAFWLTELRPKVDRSEDRTSPTPVGASSS